jgi:cold shock CspA family protein
MHVPLRPAGLDGCTARRAAIRRTRKAPFLGGQPWESGVFQAADDAWEAWQAGCFPPMSVESKGGFMEPQITFRDVPSSFAVEASIREHAAELARFHERITRCRVVVERPHHRQRQGNLYAVRVELAIPGHEIVVGREPTEHHAHEDVYVAIRDAFDAARRQLQDHARRDRQGTKHHEPAGEGRVGRLLRKEGYGFIETADGREVYFHRNSVVDGEFDALVAGMHVRFAEELGEKGPQATVVHPGWHGGAGKRDAGARP